MQPKPQGVQANCIVEFQVVHPKTHKKTWEVYEHLNLQEPTVDHVIERLELFVGRPERHDNVSAIRLTGKMTVIDQKKDSLFNHATTIKLDINVLKERTVPLSNADSIASGL